MMHYLLDILLISNSMNECDWLISVDHVKWDVDSSGEVDIEKYTKVMVRKLKGMVCVLCMIIRTILKGMAAFLYRSSL